MIVVTAPTSSIGRRVVQILLAEKVPIRLVARDPSRLPPEVRDRAEVVEGSHGDAAVVDRAFEGADAVFWLVPPDPRATSVEDAYLSFTRPAADAIGRHGVGRVVGISALGRGTPMAANAGLVTASLAMDDLLGASGSAYRALTMPSFMDNILRQVASIRDQGVFTSPVAGHLKAPTCATRDIAAAAARLLLDPSWTGTGHVAVLGPEDLSFDDMAGIMSEVLERPVRFDQVAPEAFKARLLGFGTSEAMAQATLDMMVAKDGGLDNAELRTPEASTSTTFRQWCAEVLAPAVQD